MRRALQTSSPLTVAFSSVVVNAIFLWPIAIIFTSFDQAGLEGLLILIFAGLLAPTLGRLLRFMAVDKLGLALSAPLVETTPLFGAFLAVTILQETLTLQIGIGIVCVVLGVMLFGAREGIRLTKMGVIISLASAAAFAGSDISRKVGITAVNSPFLGAAIGVTVAIIVYFLFSVSMNQPIASPRTWNRYNYLTGILTGAGVSFIFTALFVERVIIVQPLVASTPILTLFFTWIFLRKLERVTSNIAIAAILVVVGSIIVATA